MEKRKIFFDEELHKYTDEYGNIYTSVTTLISKYYEHFNSEEIAAACERIGKKPNHKDYLKYKGKSKKQILAEWELTKNVACDKGTRKHNYFEQSIKQSTGYKLVNNQFINDRIYTIEDIIGDRHIGLLNIEYFEEKGIKERYPIIFNTIYELTKAGFLIYSEVGVYDPTNLIAGLIDVPMIRGNELLIIDWKTNAAPIVFDSGYFQKDKDNNLTNTFIKDNKFFNKPISHLPASIGHKYSLQVSGYGELCEQFGLKYRGSLLFHIRSIPNKGIYSKINNIDNEETNAVEVIDLRNDFRKIKEHHYNSNHYKETKLTLF